MGKFAIPDVPGHACEGAAPVPSTSTAGDSVPSTSSAGDSAPSTSAAGKPMTNTSATATLAPSIDTDTGPLPTVSVPTDILTDDLLKILGDDPSQQKLYGKDIQPDLAIRLQHIATSGLAKETRKGLLEKYLPPANCPLIDAPALNPEVKAAIPEAIYKRDKAIELRQKQLSCVASCLAEAITTLMAESKNTELIQLLMDASKLLCDTQHSDSLTRRNFVLNNIKKELKDQLQATKIDKLLFSEELSDALKAAKAISKSSADMKLTNPKNSAKKSSKSTKNWRAPPPNPGRLKGNPRTKEPAYRNRHENSSKQSSHPAPTRSRRR